jgi:hydrogenase nickel incorporation protein HypA/HybF
VHELPATQGLMDIVLDAARNAGAVRVRTVDVVIGDLSSMVDDSVQFYFDVLSRDTVAAGAELRIQRVRAVAECGSCGASYAVQAPLVPVCEVCGSLSLRVSGGREFYIDSIEVDE